MKKFLLVMCAVIGLAFGASAQRAQLQIGYGGYTQMDASDMHDYGAVNNAWGALTAGVNFKILPSFSLGLSYTFSSTSYKHIDDANAYYHVFILNGKYDYWRNSIVRLYAHAGVGVDVTHMTAGDRHKNKTYFAFQASPIGAEVGLSRVATMFGEVGYGAQGLLQVGFRLNL
ncbi:outer membrane beta-barrel protein [uncultured Duncaniella sp.]|uniref:outer membrane beta-barrel protein n=1 Tax=uncultured Duncaniella sp. TaxID=2768039 RepID=UPI0026F3C5A5|nr:outer membrane beta-barrel protein [uncultured Duncaniella sp.]